MLTHAGSVWDVCVWIWCNKINHAMPSYK